MNLAEALEAIPGIHAELTAKGIPTHLLDRWERILVDAAAGADITRDDRSFGIAFCLRFLGPDATMAWLARAETDVTFGEVEDWLRGSAAVNDIENTETEGEK